MLHVVLHARCMYVACMLLEPKKQLKRNAVLVAISKLESKVAGSFLKFEVVALAVVPIIVSVLWAIAVL